MVFNVIDVKVSFMQRIFEGEIVKWAMLIASGVCGSVLAQTPTPTDSRRPKVDSCRVIFEHSDDGWYWDIDRHSDEAQFPPGSFFVAKIFLKIHAAADDHSPVVEEARALLMRDGDRHRAIGQGGRLEGRKISGITHYECKVYQWTK
jgi:hypothetical protein